MPRARLQRALKNFGRGVDTASGYHPGISELIRRRRHSASLPQPKFPASKQPRDDHFERSFLLRIRGKNDAPKSWRRVEWSLAEYLAERTPAPCGQAQPSS